MLNTVPAHFLSLFFFRQNLVIQCILNSQSCTHKDKLFLSLSLSFLLSKTKLISFSLAHTSLLISPWLQWPLSWFHSWSGFSLE